MLLSNSCKYRRQLLTVSRCCSTNFNFSSSPSPAKVVFAKQLLNPPDKECDEFLPWLEKKAGAEISSKLYIGKSSYGRSLFASQHIQKGDCILEVPFKVQIAPDNLPPEVKDALVDEVDHATKVAMVLLGEWKQGKDSRWAPYISCLPRLEEMHSTIFWSKNELDMICASSVYEETVKQKTQIGNDFSKIRPVQISYGKFGNATLMLDFGFTVPHNIHDQVEIQMSISDSDVLHEMKTEILQRYQLPTIRDPNYTHPPSWNCFRIREVKSVTGKGKGIPQSLRAFARVLSYNHPEDLRDLATEAAQNDGRLARRPLKDSSREIRAHSILLSHIIQLIDQYHASIQVQSMQPNRMQMALNLLAGELRILESASAWLANYCKTLSKEGVSA
ncbi:Ribosomal lysine N-methyltransferase 4 [Linum perenne]